MHYANYEHNVNKLLIYFTFYYYMIYEGPDRGNFCAGLKFKEYINSKAV